MLGRTTAGADGARYEGVGVDGARMTGADGARYEGVENDGEGEDGRKTGDEGARYDGVGVTDGMGARYVDADGVRYEGVGVGAVNDGRCICAELSGRVNDGAGVESVRLSMREGTGEDGGGWN